MVNATNRLSQEDQYKNQNLRLSMETGILTLRDANGDLISKTPGGPGGGALVAWHPTSVPATANIYKLGDIEIDGTNHAVELPVDLDMDILSNYPVANSAVKTALNLQKVEVLATSTTTNVANFFKIGTTEYKLEGAFPDPVTQVVNFAGGFKALSDADVEFACGATFDAGLKSDGISEFTEGLTIKESNLMLQGTAGSSETEAGIKFLDGSGNEYFQIRPTLSGMIIKYINGSKIQIDPYGDYWITAKSSTSSKVLYLSANGDFKWDNQAVMFGNAAITADTKCKVTYDTKGLVTAGADLDATDIPTLEISKINGLQNALDNKVNKNATAPTPGTYGKITFDSKGLVTAGSDLAWSDIPQLPQSKITGLETDISNMVMKNAAITENTKCKIHYDGKGLVLGGQDLSESDIPALSISKITNLQTTLNGKASTSALTDGSVTKVGTASVGGNLQPMYLSAGVPTAGTQLYNKNMTVNGTSYLMIRANNADAASFYAPTGAGSSGQYLKSNGSGAPGWASFGLGSWSNVAFSGSSGVVFAPASGFSFSTASGHNNVYRTDTLGRTELSLRVTITTSQSLPANDFLNIGTLNKNNGGKDVWAMGTLLTGGKYYPVAVHLNNNGVFYISNTTSTAISLSGAQLQVSFFTS